MSIVKPSFLEELGYKGHADKALLCVHGLNQRPQALKPLLKDLRELGFKPYLMHMPGHNSLGGYRQLTPEQFHDAYAQVYRYIAGQHETLPYFLGYSFGGLMGVVNHDQFPFEKMILLAPALQLHNYTFLIQPALPFLNKVNSLSLGNNEFESRYRFHSNGVPREVYRCFFSIYREAQRKEKRYLKGSRALVLVHPYDELISYKKLKKWVRRHTNWRTKSINNHDADFGRYNHLCFDKTTLGNKSYSSLVLEINEYLTKQTEVSVPPKSQQNSV